MKITVLSGGSGNDSLVRGLLAFSKDIDLKVVLSAYDNGKSTGVCRRVTNTLGVSDIRKNHSRMYSAVAPVVDKRLLEFYDGRFTFTSKEKVLELLQRFHVQDYWKSSWGIDKFSSFIDRFFENELATSVLNYPSFNLANILYSQMYKELGYEKTNSIFCDMLGIDDFVILNSFDNVELCAELEDGYRICDEGEIVELSDISSERIDKTYYLEIPKKMTLNSKAIEAVKNCDLLVISTGTFWSSIYPTLQYNDFYKYINESKAKKIWAVNNEFDKDAVGVTSIDFTDKLLELGLDLSDFTILENIDARAELRQDDTRMNIVCRSMGNKNGKHDGFKYARALLSIYYGIKVMNYYDKIIFDFDDTVWARDYLEDKDSFKMSIENVRLLEKLGDKATIISGNIYSSIQTKLNAVYGLDLSKVNFDIWSCGNGALYRCDKPIEVLKEAELKEANITIDFLNELHVNYEVIETEGHLFNIKVKPLSELERKLLVQCLNSNVGYVTACATGKTTVDIISPDNTKSRIFRHCEYDKLKTLYIGDEVDSGNDRDIANLCTSAICTSGVEETNMLLKLIMEE